MTSALLPPNSTPLERAVIDATAYAEATNPDVLRSLHNPRAIPTRLLPWLGWAWDAPLWPQFEQRQRDMCAASYRLHRQAGTMAGIRELLSYVDAEVIEVETPPARIFARAADPSRLQRWRGQFRQLRIYPLRKRESGGDGCHFAGGFGYAGRRFANASTAEHRYGRRAVIFDPADGGEIEVSWSGSVNSRDANSIDRIVIPARMGSTEHLVGRGHVGRCFASSGLARSRMLTLGIQVEPDSPPNNAIGALTQPLSVTSLRPQQIHERSQAQGLDAQPGRFAGHMTARRNDAERRVYEVYHLMEGERMDSQSSSGIGPFVGSRVSQPAYTARVRISQPARQSGRVMRAGAFVGAVARPGRDVFGPLTKVLQASQAIRDRIYFTTQCHRRRTFADRFSFAEGIRWGEMIQINRSPA